VGQWESTVEEVVNLWHGRRVFITGHTGFKGGWLSLWLASRGAHVRGYALAPATEPNLFISASVAKVIEDFRGDIRDYSRLEAALREFRPEVVFHLAAQPLVGRSYADPLETYSINVMGTAHVLEAVRKTPDVRGVLCITTDKCYQNQEWDWPYRETDPLGGYDPYASSKACAELVCASFRDSFFPPAKISQHHVALATARAGNVIGGGDWSEARLIPDLIRGFQSKQPVLIRRPMAIRPWQHVLEPLNGYLLLAEQLFNQKPQFTSSFNFGPADEDSWSVEQVATKLAAIWGEGASWKSDSVSNLHETRFLRLDSSKARAELGWKPVVRIETALEWTIRWYKAWQRGADMRQETAAQIAVYEKLLQ
jgi:CDP-glucose 4,6-dehydratase